MIPLRDNIPSQTTPWVNYTLIALNLVVFLYQLTMGDRELAAFFGEFGVVPLHYWQPQASGASILMGMVVPLLTSMFMHGGFMHVAGNMLFLWVFGDNIEDRFGHLLYPLLYLGFGLAASAGHIAFSPDSPIPTIGASGAVSGVLGAYLVFYPSARVRALLPLGFIMFYRELPAILFLGVWFLLQLVPGLLSIGDTASGGVAWWAHIIGFVAGAGLALAWRVLFGEGQDAPSRDPDHLY